MLQANQKSHRRNINRFLFSILTASQILIPELINSAPGLANPSFLEFRWDDNGKYRKLYYTQSSNLRSDRSTYHLIMKKRDRRNATLKLSIKFPRTFAATIKEKNLSFCKVSIGGMTERTKCKENIPSVFEVSKNKQGAMEIEVFPNNPVPAGEHIAVVMKIFNPRSRGMHIVNGISQTPGDLPISSYIGSWSLDIE